MRLVLARFARAQLVPKVGDLGLQLSFHRSNQAAKISAFGGGTPLALGSRRRDSHGPLLHDLAHYASRST
jgi:hypothetical protein